MKRFTTSDILLVLVNLLPVWGVWFEGWRASQVFTVYCLETIIVGCVTVLKLGLSGFFQGSALMPGKGKLPVVLSIIFLICFFILHYGIFVFVQTQIFFAVSGIGSGRSSFSVYKNLPEILGKEGLLMLGIFTVYYTLDMMFNFIGSGKMRTQSIMRVMMQPYTRIFIQQFIVIIGSFFLLFNFQKIFILIFAVVKTVIELASVRYFRKELPKEMSLFPEADRSNSGGISGKEN